MNTIFSNRMARLRDKELLRLMELAASPDIISFAGGFPASDLFPIEEMEIITKDIYDLYGVHNLQYASTTGYEPLREKIADRMNKIHHLKSNKNQIIVSSGSQQSLDMLGMLFINEGDTILCESPSYIGAINAFKAYNPNFIEVPMEEDGMNIEALKDILESNQNIKLIYVIPDFQNPTGRVWSVEKRKAFINTVKEYDIPIVEDTAYYDLAFERIKRPSITSLDKKGQVIFLGTFSKIFCPGLRIGWIYANEEILEAVRLIKPNVDLSSSSMAQRQINRYMELYDLDEHIQSVCKIYRERRDVMLEGIAKYFPNNIHYKEPKGGLFNWIELPVDKSARDLLELSLKEGVAFVPGGSFYPNSHKENVMRLNFSYMPNDKIEIGIKKLGHIIHHFID